MVEENDCGFYVDATKPEELVELLVQIKSQKTMLTQMGKNARLLAETKYDKSILCKQFAEIIESKF